jgi:putative ABC transport system substrate-binding protein
VFRIGVLSSTSPAQAMPFYDAFREELRAQGFAEPHDVGLEFRFAGGRLERFPSLAKELLRSGIDLLMAGGTQAALAARQATSTIPVVFVAANPVQMGIVTNIPRPGENVTGVATFQDESVGKQIEVLKETLPGLTEVATLGLPNEHQYSFALQIAKATARDLGIRLQLHELNGLDQIEPAFDRMTTGRIRAVVIFPHVVFLGNPGRVIQLSIARRIAPTFSFIEGADAGALYAYGPDVKDQMRLAARQVARIIKGAKPGEIPVEQSVRFLFAVNLKTAKALGLEVPQSRLVAADRVIE